MITIRTFSAEVEKGWGSELVVVNGDYCGKLLHFNAGHKFSMHFHLAKAETFYVFRGTLKLTCFDLRTADRLEYVLVPGAIVDVPRGEPHCIEAVEDSLIIEFSTHHEDADSYRVEKGASQKP